MTTEGTYTIEAITCLYLLKIPDTGTVQSNIYGKKNNAIVIKSNQDPTNIHKCQNQEKIFDFLPKI